jgi:hypothetical protein
VREPEGPRLAPTAEDQLQTIFVGDIPDDLADDWMDRISRVCSLYLISFYVANMQALGKLKEWRRATDGADKPRQFGFAIFEDAESTNRAYRMLQEFEIPSLQAGKPASKLMVRLSSHNLLGNVLIWLGPNRRQYRRISVNFRSRRQFYRCESLSRYHGLTNQGTRR